jgi:type IX secretion system PorP/SprF family membrane protein
VNKRNLIVFAILLLTSISARSQYDASFSHYWAMEPSFNPAAVGKEAKLNINIAYAMDLAGFQNNPRTMYLSADMPFFFLNNYHGVGVAIMNDKIGLFTHQKFALQYAYKQRLFGGLLSIGAQVGMLSENFDGSKLDLGESSDPAFSTSSVTGSGFDISTGLYYIHKLWYLGLSAQHINAPLINLGEKNELQIDRTYYFTGGYNIKLRNPFVTIHPSLLLRTDGVGYRADISGRLVYTNDEKVMYGGLAYSPTNSITVLIGGNFHGVSLGYSYEIYTSAISAGNGSHELFIGYQTDINLQKKGKNKHKSVRIL